VVACEVTEVEIERSSTVSETEWQSLLDQSDAVWLYHSWKWIEATAKLSSLENQYFTLKNNGRVIGGIPLQVDRRKRMAYSIFLGRAGPFWTRALPNELRNRVLVELTDSVVNWAVENGIDSVTCWMPNLAMNNLQNTRGVNPLVVAGWRDMSTHTLIADLAKTEPELWADLSHDARQKVKKARGAGYVVEKRNWQEMIEDYHRVATETYTRTGVINPHPRAYYEAVAELNDGGNGVLWVARDPSGRPVAFHNDTRYRDGSSYFIGCCETEHLPSGINYFLMWNSIIGARNDGCRWYEIGDVFPDIKRGKDSGLTTYKRKFGGELYRAYGGQINLGPGKSSLMMSVGRALPRPLRRFAKRTLLAIMHST
jgi:hypothetical protein